MPRFKRVYIEITNCCNLCCDFCPSAILRRSGRMMSIEEFQYILNQLQPYTKYLYFHLLGEPLLNPKLGTFLKLSEAAGMQVNLTTNGFLIDKVENTLIGTDSYARLIFRFILLKLIKRKKRFRFTFRKLLILLKKFKISN